MHHSIVARRRLIVKVANLRRQLQKVGNVFGADSHVIFETNEEIVMGQFVSQNEAMLTTQCVVSKCQSLILLGSFVVRIGIKQGNGIVPNLQSHIVRQRFFDHSSSFVRERPVSQNEVHVDVPSSGMHGVDRVDEGRQENISKTIVSTLRSASALVVFGEGGRDEKEAKGGGGGGVRGRFGSGEEARYVVIPRQWGSVEDCGVQTTFLDAGLSDELIFGYVDLEIG